MKESIVKQFNVSKSTSFWGNYQTYYTVYGEFKVMRVNKTGFDLNPRYIIAPQGFIQYSLPKLQGFRRNNNKHYYTTQSYNIDETMCFFLQELHKEIKKGNRLYVNQNTEEK